MAGRAGGGATGSSAGREATTDPDGWPKPRSLWKMLGSLAGAAAVPAGGCSKRRSGAPKFGAGSANSGGRAGGSGAVSSINGTSRTGGSGTVSGNSFAVTGGAAGATGADSAAGGGTETPEAALGSAVRLATTGGGSVVTTVWARHSGSTMIAPKSFPGSSWDASVRVNGNPRREACARLVSARSGATPLRTCTA